MKTEQFQYVLELFKTGSISKAAKKFYMSRPNLSNSIRTLEDELGFDILERGVNEVKFTEKGRISSARSWYNNDCKTTARWGKS